MLGIHYFLSCFSPNKSKSCIIIIFSGKIELKKDLIIKYNHINTYLNFLL